MKDKQDEIGIVIDVETIIDLIKDVSEGRTLVIVPDVETLTALQGAREWKNVTFATLQALGPTAVRNGERIEIVQ